VREALLVVTIAFLLRRLPALAEAEFHRYWRDEHGPLVASHADALGIRRYEQLHSLDPRCPRCCVPHATARPRITTASRSSRSTSLEALAAATATPEGRAASQALLDDERTFLDLERCVIWLTDSNVVIP